MYESLSKPMWHVTNGTPPPHTFFYQGPVTVRYLCFLYVSSLSVKTPLSSQVTNLVLIILQCSFQGLVPSFFLESIMLFSSWKKTDPHPHEMIPPSPPLPFQRQLLERHLLHPGNFWNPSSPLHVTLVGWIVRIIAKVGRDAVKSLIISGWKV
jgi:hypothetical protein